MHWLLELVGSGSVMSLILVSLIFLGGSVSQVMGFKSLATNLPMNEYIMAMRSAP